MKGRTTELQNYPASESSWYDADKIHPNFTFFNKHSLLYPT
jgi:hypothetical protein